MVQYFGYHQALCNFGVFLRFFFVKINFETRVVVFESTLIVFESSLVAVNPTS